MSLKRPASNPPPGPGQPSGRLRTLRTTATNETLSVAGSSSVAGGCVGSSGSRVGFSVRRSSATISVKGSGSGHKGGGKPVSTSGDATGKLAGSSRGAQVGAGLSRTARPTPSGAVGSLGESSASIDSDEDDEDGVNWEDVDLGPQAITNFLSSAQSEKPMSAPLSLTLSGKGEKPARTVRTITPVERRIRWEAHKMHLLCLLHHVSLRNRWCSSPEVQKNLLPLVKSSTRRLLIDNPKDQPFRRSQLFLEGLKALSDSWVEEFRVMRAGLSKCRWDGPENFIHKGGDPPLGYEQFVIVSRLRKGSRDIGAQLFCAMLRSIGVTCRLVCSLQVLPFTFSSHEPPMKILADAAITGPGRGVGYISKTWLRNCRQNDYGTRHDERGWPVYWVEAWSVGGQKWIAVDPFATKTVGKPSVIEPPVQVPGNLMSYVVGFEDDGDCTDVTRRYAQAFITKTRKVRVTGTPAGEAWWDKVMTILATGAHPDRQQLEQTELANKTVHEPIPKSLKDLKGHPLYVLERHLKRDESFKVRRKCSTLTTGSGKNIKTEPIYRREDVIKLRSLENWTRLGRTVKPEEEFKPIKYVKAVRLPSTKLRNARSGYVEPEMNGLYAESQTELYVPKPLVNGRLVKNKFGNIDLFVESMLPEGAVHLPQKNTDKAARLVGVDFAPAITGFEYRHGHAYPVATGIVVAKEYKEAVQTVHEGLVEAQDEKAARNRDMKALRMWRRFITKIRILDHVSRIPEEQEGTHHPMTMMANDQGKAVGEGVVEVVEADEEEFGGFRGGFYSVSEELDPPVARKPAKKHQSLRQLCENLRASPPASATKTTAKKTVKSRPKLTTSKAKPSARKLRGRKAITESDEEEAEESEDSDTNSSGTQRRNYRSHKFSFKYNFDADSSDDDTATSGGGGGFLQQQESKVASRRSTRLAAAAKGVTPVKYTLDEDDDEDELELELEEQQQQEEKKMQSRKKKRASGGFLIESDDSFSELSDEPSDLLTEAEYEALIGGEIIESNSALEQEDRDSNGLFAEVLEKQDDEGDDEDKGGNNVELRGAVDVFEMLHDGRNAEDLNKVDYVMRGAGPVAEDGTVDTAKTDKGMADTGGDDHNDNDISVGKSLLVGNEAGGAEVVMGAADALLDTMAGIEKMHHKERTPSGGNSSSMLLVSEDTGDKDNTDLDRCNY
ncbi:hypothetical protein HOY80DRAFT_963201 [Tuber brumale]|nr:hypothetical protein HOY80DRAFT_963201 [Tuber brumale]